MLESCSRRHGASRQSVAEEHHLSFDPSASYYELLKLITEELIRLSTEGKTAVLFIDEAQAMPEESLEAIRLLTTLQSSSGEPTPLQVILFGQPGLDELLQRPALKELNRDLSVSFQLAALDKDGVEAYLNHRLIKSGYNGYSLFTEKAIDLIFQSSKGVPRLINILAHKSLMVAFGKGASSLTDTHVKLAIADTESAQPQGPRKKHLFSS